MHKLNTQSTNQSGMTFLGVVFLLVFAGIFALAGLRLVPLYMENMGVKHSIEAFQEEYKGNTKMTVAQMKRSLQRRLDVQNVSSLKANDISIKKSRNGYTVDASYHPKVNYMGNVNFVVDFEHKFTLGK